MVSYVSIFRNNHIEGVDRGAAWLSHTEWNDQGCLGETATTCLLVLSGDSYFYGSKNQISYSIVRYRCISIGFRFSIWFLCKLVLKLCDGKSMLPVVKVFVHNMHMSPQKLIIFPSFLAKNNFVCFSHDSTFNIAYHTMVSPNIMFNFHWYCMLQSFSSVWCFCTTPVSMHVTVILAIMLKSAMP